MEYKRILGKVVPTSEGPWVSSRAYENLSIVYHVPTLHAYISKKDVPAGVDIENREYWQPFNVSGYSDSNLIILGRKNTDATLTPYTLETAIAEVASVGRKPGIILCFYNENSDRVDLNGCWELWQFNSNNVFDWENVQCWTNLYYNYNKFVGFFISEAALHRASFFPDEGTYAYVGASFNTAVVYRCYAKGVWTRTEELAKSYVSINISGDVTIGDNGNWFIDGADTGFAAVGPKGDKVGFRINADTLDVEYNYFTSDSTGTIHPLDNWKTLYNLKDDATRFFEVRYNAIPAGVDPSVTQEDDIDNYLKSIITFNLPKAPSVEVGNVSVGAAGTASVSNTGNRFAAVLDFVIPQGLQGPTGPTGDGVNIQYNVATLQELPTTGVENNAFAVVGNSSSATTYFWNGSSWIERKLNLQYNNSKIVQEPGNSEINVLSQAAASSYIAGNKYYECSSAAATTEKVISAPNYLLKVGDYIKVKFINNNIANSPVLNINGQGGIPIFYNGKQASSTNSWRYNETVDIYYDGANYYANSTTDISADYVSSLDKVKILNNLQISNGSIGNSGNTHAIRIGKKNAGKSGKIYTIFTTRPVTQGYVYCYGYSKYSSMDGSLIQNVTDAKDLSVNNTHGENRSITLGSNDVGFTFSISETNGTVYNSLRVTDFVGYDVFVVESDAINPSVIYSCYTKEDVVAKSISISPNTYVYNTPDCIIVKFKYCNRADNPTLSINNEPAKPLYYKGIVASKFNTWNYDETVQIVTNGVGYYAYPLDSMNNNSSCISDRIVVKGNGSTDGVYRLLNFIPKHRYRVTLDLATWNFTPQLAAGSTAFNIYDLDNNSYSARITIDNLPTNEQTEFEFTANNSGRHSLFLRADATVTFGMTVKDLSDEDLIILSSKKISFTGKGNTFSRTRINSDRFKPGYKYKLSFDNIDWPYNDISSQTYKFELYYYINNAVVNRPITVMGNEDLKYNYYFIIPEDLNLTDTIWYVGGRAINGTVVDIDIEDITNKEIDELLLEQLNHKSKYETHNRLNLLYFSDVHAGGYTNNVNILKNILAWGNKYRNYIDDVLHAGDIVVDNVSPGNYNGWNSSPYISTMLNVIGNHDCSRREDLENTDINGNNEISGYVVDADPTVFYNRFFAPYISNWNVVQPELAAEKGYNYYYKDYTNAAIRLIVLDSMYPSDVQNAWLTNVLEDARANDLSVICCRHYPGPVVKMNVSFNSLVRTPSGSIAFLDIVQNFINEGGKFICWLTGHMHQDFFGYLNGYPGQLEFSTVNAGVHDKKQERSRHIYNEPNGTFNIINVCPDFGILTIKRFGLQYDEFLRKQDTLVYDYLNKIIIQNY